MAYNIVGDFYSLISVGLFDSASILLIICFIIWEIPRSVKLMSEEYTEGLYPEHGRVVDFVLLALGLLAVFLFMSESSAILKFMKTPSIIAFFLILLIVIPLIIFIGFLRRFFGTLEHKESITIFLVHGFLDLMHTLFYISLSLLVIPSVAFLLFA